MNNFPGFPADFFQQGHPPNPDHDPQDPNGFFLLLNFQERH